VSQLSDGFYDIRAGARDSQQTEIYFCEPLRGSIDRDCPQQLNPAQPADGILAYGDQISVSFSEFINPNSVIARMPSPWRSSGPRSHGYQHHPL
jgi:hypothetical protein